MVKIETTSMNRNATLFIALVCLCACSQQEPSPNRPASVPSSAAWVESVEGIWIDCDTVFTAPVAKYHCSVFSKAGEIVARGGWLPSMAKDYKKGRTTFEHVGDPLKSLDFSSFDGTFIRLIGDRLLIPHGEIDFPSQTGGGQVVTFRFGTKLSTNEYPPIPEWPPIGYDTKRHLELISRTRLYQSLAAIHLQLEIWPDEENPNVDWKFYWVVSRTSGTVTQLEYLRLREKNIQKRRYDQDGDDSWLPVFHPRH